MGGCGDKEARSAGTHSAPFDRVIVRECVVPGMPGVCDWSRFTVRGVIFLSVDHGLAAGTNPPLDQNRLMIPCLFVW